MWFSAMLEDWVRNSFLDLLHHLGGDKVSVTFTQLWKLVTHVEVVIILRKNMPVICRLVSIHSLDKL
jgi:hypothetical protein